MYLFVAPPLRTPHPFLPLTGNNALKASLKERRNKADDRTLQLKKANEQLMDDDGIIERIFNSLTGMEESSGVSGFKRGHMTTPIMNLTLP